MRRFVGIRCLLVKKTRSASCSAGSVASLPCRFHRLPSARRLRRRAVLFVCGGQSCSCGAQCTSVQLSVKRFCACEKCWKTRTKRLPQISMLSHDQPCQAMIARSRANLCRKKLSNQSDQKVQRASNRLSGLRVAAKLLAKTHKHQTSHSFVPSNARDH